MPDNKLHFTGADWFITESELADHEENLAKLVWLTGCDLSETGEAHFSAY